MAHTTKKMKTKSSSRSIVFALGAALLLSACAKDGRTTGSIPSNLRKPVAEMNQTELRQATDYWSKQYEKNPKSKHVGLQFATALRVTGRNEQALAVMQKVSIYHPKDREVLGAYGKALAGAGDLPKALKTIQRAQTPDNPDWKLHSAEGAIYDQMGNSNAARQAYRKALDLKPGDASVLSNLGLSYLLEGDLRSSETYLRQAIDQRGADSRVRQNLALVIGLQGRFDEAKTVAAGELPPAEAQANVKFLQQMLSEQNSWSQLKDKKA